MKIVQTTIITILLLFLTIFLAGGGHGTYIPAKLIYPFTMLIAEFKNEIGIVGILIAIIQIPTYALILNNKPNWKYYLLGIHCIAVIIGLYIGLATKNWTLS
ncbi:hypothetical protein MED217_15085 [Leeuwenhoekiella blandensis MED217]|uniref:Uncharacterized protein n=1 Tax=Leeuwenhoekiella blandensis (strain CECT 7118 / CCUG 51940 / KCTC 22103 / MED217) TaxID=398720 RepID=A3XG71_LEEBM|nr:hypothetical protein MED217_15085 [Leeuwenhoekiella blandensis MED217]